MANETLRPQIRYTHTRLGWCFGDIIISQFSILNNKKIIIIKWDRKRMEAYTINFPLLSTLSPSPHRHRHSSCNNAIKMMENRNCLAQPTVRNRQAIDGIHTNKQTNNQNTHNNIERETILRQWNGKIHFTWIWCGNGETFRNPSPNQTSSHHPCMSNEWWKHLQTHTFRFHLIIDIPYNIGRGLVGGS